MAPADTCNNLTADSNGVEAAVQVAELAAVVAVVAANATKAAVAKVTVEGSSSGHLRPFGTLEAVLCAANLLD